MLDAIPAKKNENQHRWLFSAWFITFECMALKIFTSTETTTPKASAVWGGLLVGLGPEESAGGEHPVASAVRGGYPKYNEPSS